MIQLTLTLQEAEALLHAASVTLSDEILCYGMDHDLGDGHVELAAKATQKVIRAIAVEEEFQTQPMPIPDFSNIRSA